MATVTRKRSSICQSYKLTIQQFEGICGEQKRQASSVIGSSQVIIKDCLERLQPLPNDNPTAQKTTILIGKWWH